MDDNNRNFLLAALLSLVVIFVWNVYFFEPPPPPQQPQQTQEETQSLPQLQTETQPPVYSDEDAVPGSAPKPNQAAQEVGESDERVVLKTERLEGSVNLRGARIDDLKLLGYRETLNPESPTVRLLHPTGTPNAYFAEFGYARNENLGALPGPSTIWKKRNSQFGVGRPLMLEYVTEGGVVFSRTISIDEDYMFTIEDSIKNNSGSDVVLQPYGRIARYGEPETEGIFVLHEGMIGAVDDEGLEQIDYDDIQDENIQLNPSAVKGWLGFTDKYWATALIPNHSFVSAYKHIKGAKPFYQTEYLGGEIRIVNGETKSVLTNFFAGAKKVDIIDAYYDELGIPLFDKIIDWGWLYWITKPLFIFINYIFEIVGNFGVAILVVTVIIKLVFFPLANKSYVSMANMKRMQPEMTAIRERFPDDRQAQQKALMELYKKEKINPAAGCWPILIQIPVFFALYKVLYVTIEMRHAPFFGWVKDLSAPDPTSIFNLFGLLPYDVPLFLMVGIWPLLMGITMFIQMQMNPAPPDPTQQLIFKWMPVVFTFMLATFPAGLVIYWAWNNFLSILQQGAIMKRQGAKIELWDNLKTMFTKKA